MRRNHGGWSRFRAIGIRLIPACLVFHVWLAPAFGDGGTLRVWERQGRYEIAVFTSPNPLVAGPVDISVLILDSRSGDPVRDAKVIVKIEPLGRPGEAVSHPATTEAATNKLLLVAVFELPKPGSWLVEIAIDGMRDSAPLRFKMEAAGGPPEWMAFWPWVCWPAPVILLYGIHQRLVWRKTHSRR